MQLPAVERLVLTQPEAERPASAQPELLVAEESQPPQAEPLRRMAEQRVAGV
jgi:hypothetical protein